MLQLLSLARLRRTAAILRPVLEPRRKRQARGTSTGGSSTGATAASRPARRATQSIRWRSSRAQEGQRAATIARRRSNLQAGRVYVLVPRQRSGASVVCERPRAPAAALTNVSAGTRFLAFDGWSQRKRDPTSTLTLSDGKRRFDLAGAGMSSGMGAEAWVYGTRCDQATRKVPTYMTVPDAPVTADVIVAAKPGDGRRRQPQLRRRQRGRLRLAQLGGGVHLRAGLAVGGNLPLGRQLERRPEAAVRRLLGDGRRRRVGGRGVRGMVVRRGARRRRDRKVSDAHVRRVPRRPRGHRAARPADSPDAQFAAYGDQMAGMAVLITRSPTTRPGAGVRVARRRTQPAVCIGREREGAHTRLYIRVTAALTSSGAQLSRRAAPPSL